ncbi:MAG: hypothetical protein MAG453_00164 [Calditrichaeota bacterium]|nr:hypothetical protein [Calditrichota bacterium]
MRSLLIVVTAVFVIAAAGAQPPVWKAELIAERARVDSIYAHSPLSPFASIGQAVFRPGNPLRVVLAADTLLLGKPSADTGLPMLEFIFRAKQDVVYVRSPQGGPFHLNRRPIGPVPQPVTSADTVHAAEFLLKVYKGSSSARARAFKPGGALQPAFHGLSWYAPADQYRVSAHVEPAAGDTLVMPTSAGLEKSYIRHSRLRFALAGGSHELTLFAPASAPGAYGFIPFTDATSGGETYGGGRYLDLDLPAAGSDSLLLDFNMAYNPLCAYVPHYNCPIPPAENALEIPIHAGEKAYGDHD